MGRFVDVSAFQPIDIDWKALHDWSAQDDGVARVAIRATYGLLVDGHYASYRGAALGAGFDSILYYHYAYPQLNSATEAADLLYHLIGSLRVTDQIALDYEEEVAQATPEWALDFLGRCYYNFGITPALYASPAYIASHCQDQALANFPLWLADWTYDEYSRPLAPGPWSSYEAIQYSDKGSVPGVPGTVDVDIYLLSSPPGLQEMNLEGNMNVEQQAQDTYISTDGMLKTCYGGSARTDSGIYNSWKQAYLHGHNVGPPTTLEFPSVDWNGNPIVCVQFAQARCEWSNGSATFYDHNDQGFYKA